MSSEDLSIVIILSVLIICIAAVRIAYHIAQYKMEARRAEVENRSKDA